MTHTVNVALQFLVGVDGYHRRELLVVFDIVKGMIPAVFRILCGMYQMFQHCPLQCLSPFQMLLQSLLAGLKHISYYLSQTHCRTNICLQR